MDQNREIVKLYHLNIDNGKAEVENAERVNTPEVGGYPQQELKDGQYEFVDLVPGIYYIEYTYGTGKDEDVDRKTIIKRPDDKNTEVRTQDFKSTVIADENPAKVAIQDQYTIVNDGYEWKTYISEDEKREYKDKEKSHGYWYEDKNIKDYSSAIDDYNTRSKINEYLEHNRYEITEGYNNKNQEMFDNYNMYVMKSRTPSMCVAIEDKDNKPSAPRKKKKKDEHDPNEFSVYDGNKDDTSSGDERITSEYDISFGIVERPRQRLEVAKEISYVNITLANGQILLEGDPHDPNISKYFTYPEPGRLKIEIDNELIEGAMLNVTYDISVANYSDKNYNSFGYYMFGRGDNGRYIDENTLVKTSVRWIDYLDKKLNLVDDKWKIYESKKITDEGYLEPEITAKNNDYNYIVSNGMGGQSESGLSSDEHYYTVITRPGEIAITPIHISKLLATAKEMSYDNKVEFLGVHNSVGRFYYSNEANNKDGIIRYGRPGDNQFDSDKGTDSNDKKDPDNNSREPLRAEIDIVPPTGQARIYYVIGISCLVLLVGGIVLIKKKVLD